MNLYQKGLLAFASVILIAIATVAVVVGHQTETAFRRYAMLYSGRTQMLAEALVAYYEQQGSWEGVQAALPQLAVPGQGQGRHGAPESAGDGEINYRVADAQRRVVARTEGSPEGELSPSEASAALHLSLAGETIGYLMLETQGAMTASLDAPAVEFLSRLRWALALGGGVAFLAALLLAGLLTRSIVAPVRTLSQTAETIAEGHFDARAVVSGEDEIAQLAATFNQMAASLERAEAARRAQTADIAHELRNPLAVLQSTLEALADGIAPPTPDNIEPALDQVKTLNRLVEDLRTLALADAGQLKLDRQPVDMHQLIGRVIDAHKDTFRAQHLTLTLVTEATGPTPNVVESAEAAPVVPADYARLTQVLNDILSNAVRYVPAGGQVRISVEAQADGVVVCVADDGPGIPEAALPRLFERFWRGEPSRSRVTGGSGLGLAIADQIIQAHHGRIWGEPTPGGGLTICFWLPEK
ncbi:MAG: sensor histidine kinase [Anaerolineae bacterium]